jgi:alkylation response protein AidB-like acyl-CoA dehydrogenase
MLLRATDKGQKRRGVDFQLTANQQRLQHRCRELAPDFARRLAAHDRGASHRIENYERLREEGFLALTVGKEWGGAGASFLDHTDVRRHVAEMSADLEAARLITYRSAWLSERLRKRPPRATGRNTWSARQ